MLMASPRRRRDAYSAEMRLVLTRMPPIPNPVTTRQRPSSAADVEVAVKNSPTALTMSAIIIIFLRPIRSATGPRTSAPTAMPRSAALMTSPNVVPDRLNSSLTSFDVNEIARTSYPSSALRKVQMPTISH